MYIAEADSGAQGYAPPFLQSLVFLNHFEELKSVLFEAELIINNVTLTYVYPNIYYQNIFNTQSFIIWQQLLYSSNTTRTTSTVVRNLNIPSSTTDKINCTSNNFLDDWRHQN